MYHAHAGKMFEAGNYYVDASQVELEAVNDHHLRHNVATWTGRMAAGAVLATAGVLVMNAYNYAVEAQAVTEPTGQVRAVETATDDAFPVGAYVAPQTKSNQ